MKNNSLWAYLFERFLGVVLQGTMADLKLRKVHKMGFFSSIRFSEDRKGL